MWRQLWCICRNLIVFFLFEIHLDITRIELDLKKKIVKKYLLKRYIFWVFSGYSPYRSGLAFQDCWQGNMSVHILRCPNLGPRSDPGTTCILMAAKQIPRLQLMTECDVRWDGEWEEEEEREEGGRRREGRWNLALEMLPTGYLGTDLRTP